jgi:hypothetical protein
MKNFISPRDDFASFCLDCIQHSSVEALMFFADYFSPSLPSCQPEPGSGNTLNSKSFLFGGIYVETMLNSIILHRRGDFLEWIEKIGFLDVGTEVKVSPFIYRCAVTQDLHFGINILFFSFTILIFDLRCENVMF